MPLYGVTLNIRGTAYAEVDAAEEDEAVDKAFDLIEIEHIEDWEPTKIGAETEILSGEEK